jgi:hypothetical protein
MRYMFLIYSREQPGDRSEEELERLRAAHYAVMDEAKRKGIFQGAEPLRHTTTATTVRMEGGKPLILDGPFAETKEQLGGFWVIKAADLDAALAVAARGSAACGGPVEVRPFQDLPE